LEAVARGLAVPDAALPKFPRAPRWDRDPEFDDRVARLKTVRDQVATQLDLDPGVLCSRDRMEAVARRNPRHVDELAEIKELRGWQAEVLGEQFVNALAGIPATNAGAASKAAAKTSGLLSKNPDQSPYRE